MTRDKAKRKRWFKSWVKAQRKAKRKEKFDKDFRNCFVRKGILEEVAPDERSGV